LLNLLHFETAKNGSFKKDGVFHQSELLMQLFFLAKAPLNAWPQISPSMGYIMNNGSASDRTLHPSKCKTAACCSINTTIALQHAVFRAGRH